MHTQCTQGTGTQAGRRASIQLNGGPRANVGCTTTLLDARAALRGRRSGRRSARDAANDIAQTDVITADRSRDRMSPGPGPDRPTLPFQPRTTVTSLKRVFQ